MARYSRRTGPAADLNLSASFQNVPGLTVTRRFGAGELLVSYRLVIRNDTGGTQRLRSQITLDGVATIAVPSESRIGTGNNITISDSHIITIDEGPHTVALQANQTASNNSFVNANSAQLTVIELPLWDQDTDIT